MGFSSAANAQNQATQMAMMVQAQQAAQAQQAIQQGQQQAAGALQQGQTQGANALNQYYNQGVGFQQPYLSAGAGATNQLAQMLAGQGLAQGPTLQQLQMDPSYAWRLQQGQGALQNSIRAGIGGANAGSGAAMKAITDYAQNAASQEYGNAYNRFMQQRQMQLGALQNLSGQGAGAANQALGLAGQTGGNLANLYGTTGSNLSNVYTGAGQQLAANYNQLGQNIGQGYANMGAANASAYMGPTNLMAQLAGQGLQGLGMWAGGGFKNPWATPTPTPTK